jgi:hypothetical protein
MSVITGLTGYDGPDPKRKDEKPKIPPPEDRKWEIKTENIGHSEDESTHVIVELDGEPIGMIRMPDNAHLRWFRERIQG